MFNVVLKALSAVQTEDLWLLLRLQHGGGS